MFNKSKLIKNKSTYGFKPVDNNNKNNNPATKKDKYGMSEYQRFIHLSRYARWNDDLGRRETWEETVARYCNFWKGRFGEQFPYELIYNAITNLDCVPSMRCFMTAGPALERDEMAGYNCSFIAVDHQRAFDEIMYILMCGTGVGFSVERESVNQLPVIAEEFHKTDTVINVSDSRVGWASSYRELISLLYSGRIPKWDTSKVRGAGERLKTFGGRASGPAPLVDLFEFTIAKFRNAAGRKLTSLECHDIVCKIAEVVVVGGVRRSALISLSNLSDDRMRNAKNGQWWESEVQRALANNSAAYTEKPEIEIFLKEWLSLIESKSGERGIFNRVAANKKAKENGRREWEDQRFGTNPCGEIILRSSGLCNLSEVIVRAEDSLEDLKRKVELATIIGTFQSTLTNFRYVRSVWRRNAEEERLLGVSLTGIMDHLQLATVHNLRETNLLTELKQVAIDTNKKWAAILGINPSVAITTVKPSGTVSQLADTASGIHPRYAPYYVRTVRCDMKDPLSRLMVDAGVPHEADVTKPESVWVFEFPQRAPEKCTIRTDMSAIQQLEHYSQYQRFWCEHNPSITVYVKNHEWLEVGAWVYKNFDIIGGVSFLPFNDNEHNYRQAPYQEIDEATYQKLVESFPNIDWSRLSEYEKENETTSSHDLSCSSGVCELVDIVKHR
jgi:ribonucleoside-triphosphate reductase